MTKTKKYNRNARFNITKYNGYLDTSQSINNNVINNEIETNNPTVHTINGKRYFKGMKLVGNDNLKDKNIYNSEIYTIDKILKDSMVLVSSNNIYINVSYKLLKRFGYAYSMTVYRYQGSTVNEPYNICQLDIMSKREMYTSLSRASKYEYLNFDYNNKEFIDKPIVKETTLLIGIPMKDR
jgi:ATP-dependent exoDNAse (exonuclease V) alpha subunit